MYCENCGKPNSDNAKFCAACGKEIPAQPIPNNSETETPQSPKPLKKKTLLKTLIFAGGGVLVAAAVILVLVFTVWSNQLAGTWHWDYKEHKAGDGWDLRITNDKFEPDSFIEFALTDIFAVTPDKFTYKIMDKNVIQIKTEDGKSALVGYILQDSKLKLVTIKGDVYTFIKK